MGSPAGFKNFVTGTTLLEGDLDNYLMAQSIMSFADAAARDAALTSPSEGMHAFLKDTNKLVYYDGAAWQNSGITIAADPLWDAAGDVVYGTGADVGARLAIGTAAQVLQVNSGATAPEWVDAAGGGATVVRKTADESVTSSETTQNDDHLLFAVGANETWVCQFFLKMSGDAAGDIRVGVSVPSGSVTLLGIGPAPGVTIQEGDAKFTVSTGLLTFGTPYSGTANPVTGLVTAVVTVGGTGGNVVLQWAQLTSNATATNILTDSVLVANKVA